uniref:Small RNA 2'-O-methyltransferase n=1 Tax=Magallana gigas TaxID=29159 RepID=K1QRK6_MAGGI
MNSKLPTDTNDLENNENDSATHDADSQKLTSTIKLEDENIGSIRFYPPLFMQRYSFTAKVLEKHDVKWVADLGCSECGIVRFYREVPSLHKIQLVDIDQPTLEFNKNLIKPRPSDYIFKRENPLSIEIYEGSATDLDQRIIGCDAVSMVEFIEHLYPETLTQVEESVFGHLHPSLVVVTTPNYEFNSLFPGEPRFRHYDHKFEWTRSEFQKWGQDICDRYRYTVEFSGIGDPPTESQHVGYCSQAAIFTSSFPRKIDVAESTFPHKDKAKLTSDEILKLEVPYTINLLKQGRSLMDTDHSSEGEDEDEDQVLIPISRLMNFSTISKIVDEDSLRKFLVENGYQFTGDQSKIIIPLEVEWNDMYGSDYEDFETEIPAGQTISISTNDAQELE